MLAKSANYSTVLAAANHYAEIKVLIDGVYYNEANGMELSTSNALMGDQYSLGNVIVNQFTARFYGLDEADIHRYSEVDLFVRFNNGSGTVTNWLPKGKYIVAEANYDTESEIMAVTAYDYLCKSEVVPYPQGDTIINSWVGETMRTVAVRMATLLGIALEDSTQVSEETYPAPPFDFTIREILADIGLIGVGNWYLTYVNSGNETNPVATPKLRLWHTTDTGTVTALGRDVTAFEELPPTSGVGEVEIIYGYNSEGVKMVKTAQGPGSVDVSYTVKTFVNGDNNGVDTMTILAQKLAANYFPATYQPFTAKGSELDMACELGDPVSCNSHTAILGSIDTNWNRGMWTDISAPTIPQDEEFKYTPKAQRQAERVERDTSTNTAKIVVNSDSITAEVERATTAEDELNTNIRSTLTQTADSIRAEIVSVQTDLDGHAQEQAKFIEYGPNGLVLGDEGSETKAVLTQDKLALTRGGDEKAYIGADPNDLDGNGNPIYKFYVAKGHVGDVDAEGGELETGNHWSIIASGADNGYRWTIKWRP